MNVQNLCLVYNNGFMVWGLCGGVLTVHVLVLAACGFIQKELTVLYYMYSFHEVQ